MKRLERIALALAALAAGGGLGRLLLRDPSHIKIMAFFIACFALGTVFYRIDKNFFAK